MEGPLAGGEGESFSEAENLELLFSVADIRVYMWHWGRIRFGHVNALNPTSNIHSGGQMVTGYVAKRVSGRFFGVCEASSSGSPGSTGRSRFGRFEVEELNTTEPIPPRYGPPRPHRVDPSGRVSTGPFSGRVLLEASTPSFEASKWLLPKPRGEAASHTVLGLYYV